MAVASVGGGAASANRQRMYKFNRYVEAHLIDEKIPLKDLKHIISNQGMLENSIRLGIYKHPSFTTAQKKIVFYSYPELLLQIPEIEQCFKLTVTQLLKKKSFFSFLPILIILLSLGCIALACVSSTSSEFHTELALGGFFALTTIALPFSLYLKGKKRLNTQNLISCLIFWNL
jgi:hypothetical protein